MSTNDIRLITFSKYIKPKPQVNTSKGWVLNGKNNGFYQYIIDRNNGSTTNSSINSSYSDLIYGNGLSIEGKIDDKLFVKKTLKKDDLRRIINDFQLFGECAIDVMPNKKGELQSISHIPKDKTAPSVADDDFNINSYWISADWSNTYKYPPEELPTFSDNTKQHSIYNVKPYQAGDLYFANPSYFSCLQYCEVEEEISNMYLTSIKQGLSAGYIINIPDGISWTPEQKNKFEKKVKEKLTGSTNTSNFIISFQGRDVSITVEPFPVNENIHKQWEFLTDEAIQKILTAHKATSPSLVGIISSSGFSNTADEMDTAEEQLMKRVITPKQRYITDALEHIYMQYGVNVELSFRPLTEAKIEPTKLSMCEHTSVADELISLGQKEDLENYDIIQEIEVDYEEEKSLKFASTGVARPNASSEQDSENILIRYRYVGNDKPEREFCRKMISAEKVYRKEDIQMMSSKPVNAGWGVNGADTYDIWLYKGGGNCYHKWNRVIYAKKGFKIDVNSPLAQTISTSEARRKGYKVPVNDPRVSIAPINMPNQGFVNK